MSPILFLFLLASLFQQLSCIRSISRTIQTTPLPSTPAAIQRRELYRGTSYAALAIAICGAAVPSSKAERLPESWYNPRNERIYDTRRRSYLPTVSAAALIEEELTNHNQRVVVIGEIHSNPCHHRVEFDVVKAFFNSNKDKSVTGDRGSFTYAIGLECFYRQHQAALDRYVFEHKSFKTLEEETKWSEAWGYDLNYYAKIFSFAAQNKIRLLGLNIPYAAAKLVGSIGLADLPINLKSVLPEIDTTNRRHRELFDAAIGYSSGHKPSSNSAMDSMYLVQCLWEDYMAETAALYLNKDQTSRLCVIAGVGHVKGRVGIPDRIAKRTNTRPFVIVPEQVDWLSDTGLPDIAVPLQKNDCDWAWYTEPEIV